MTLEPWRSSESVWPQRSGQSHGRVRLWLHLAHQDLKALGSNLRASHAEKVLLGPTADTIKQNVNKSINIIYIYTGNYYY